MPKDWLGRDNRKRTGPEFPEAEVRGFNDGDTTTPIDGGRGEDVDPRLDFAGDPNDSPDADRLFL